MIFYALWGPKLWSGALTPTQLSKSPKIKWHWIPITSTSSLDSIHLGSASINKTSACIQKTVAEKKKDKTTKTSQ
jgi:hypothetical protein